MDLLGLDAGWSKRRRSCGVACLRSGTLLLDNVFAEQMRVGDAIPADARPSAVAIDAPLLGLGQQAAPSLRRLCESLFIHAPFHNRCKPGLSHVSGTGLQLREVGEKLGASLSKIAPATPLDAHFPRGLPSANFVEAFPNAFLRRGPWAGCL